MDKGFTKVPNILLNGVMKMQLTSIELKLIMVIWRYTNGFMRESAELPISFLASEIGSSKSVVSRQIARLIEIGVVKIAHKNRYSKVRALMINEDVDNWGAEVKTQQEIDCSEVDDRAVNSKVDQAVNSEVDQAVNSEVDQAVNSEVDRAVNSKVDQAVNSEVDQAVNSEVDRAVNSEVDHTVNYRCTGRSTNKDNINIYLFKNIIKRVPLTTKLEEAVTEWLVYKTERGESYAKIPMKALITMIKDKAELWGEDEVIAVIRDCIASGYKNIVWEKLKIRSARRNEPREDDFLEKYDHSALEKLSRGIGYD